MTHVLDSYLDQMDRDYNDQPQLVIFQDSFCSECGDELEATIYPDGTMTSPRCPKNCEGLK